MSRRPKPTKAKELDGNPGHRPLPEDEWEPDATPPECPEHLGPLGKRLWEELIVRLDPVLTSVDGLGVEMICRSYEEWREHLKVRDHSNADRSWKQIRAMMIEYGLTPAARTKVQPVKPGQKDPLRDFLNRGDASDQAN